VILTADSWTVIASSGRRADARRSWRFKPGYNGEEMLAAAFAERVLLMHRRADNEWELVARIAPGCWRHVKRWRDRHPLRPRV
jgi:hypothetical protein